MNKTDHEQAVWEFLKNAAKTQPERCADLDARYPILSGYRIRRLRRREYCSGLIGLQPCRLPGHVLALHDLDGTFDE